VRPGAVRAQRHARDAVAQAAEAAAYGEAVVLSPACASFDQFRDYADRGDTFRRLVEAELARGADASGAADARTEASRG